MLRSSLCDYCDVYILVSGTTTVPNTGEVASTNIRKSIIIKNCAPFTDCISEIDNIQIDNAKHIDIVMLRCNFIEYNDNYYKRFGSLWQYYKDKPFSNANGATADNDNSALFKFKIKIAGRIGNLG